MLRFYPEQLSYFLRKQGLSPCYLLCGNEPLLLKESQECIIEYANDLYYENKISIVLDTNIDWEKIFNLCRIPSLFFKKQILVLIVPEMGVTQEISDNLIKIISLLHKDILLILTGNTLSSAQENSHWFKIMENYGGTLVHCITPKLERMFDWISYRAKKMNFMIDDAVCHQLCYYFEGNLLSLVQTLEHLSLIYPDGILTSSRVEIAVQDSSEFYVFHWVDAVLAGKLKRAIRILRKLHVSTIDPVILLRSIERNIFMLIDMKRNSNCSYLDKDKVVSFRKKHIIKTLERLNIEQLYCSVKIMTQTEIAIKNGCKYPNDIWMHFYLLSFLICDPSIYSSIRNLVV